MSKYDLPEDIKRISGDHLVYRSNEVELIIEECLGGPEVAYLNMYLAGHKEYPEIVPDDPCEHDVSGEVSDVSDLPTKYESLFMGVVDELRDRGYEISGERVGVCTGCVSLSNPDGTLTFTSFFE